MAGTSRWVCIALGALPLFAISCAHSATVQSAKKVASPVPQPLQALLVGGGPDIENNQAAIEGNIRYLNRLLPPRTPRITLFADGQLDSETVLIDSTPDPADTAQRLWKMLFDTERPEPDYWVETRKPRLGTRLDGPSTQPSIQQAFGRLKSTAPLLLFFTGHGSNNEEDYDNNVYNLWGDGELSVRELSQQIARLPKKTPVMLVMVQCYSGAFGNVLFQDGDPQRGLVSRDIAGFFAATRDRMAAGCTSEVDEAEYHDFTSYFFAALSGRDRVGRRVTGADYNRDGRVGGDEAFYYTVIHDKSIDVPVCTSDVFVRRYATISGAQRASSRYSQVRAWASPAQRAALDVLSSQLKLTGENRLAQARQIVAKGSSPSLLSQLGAAWEQGRAEGRADINYQTARDAARKRVALRWPALAGDVKARAAVKATVLSAWECELEDTDVWHDLLQADADLTTAEAADSRQEEALEEAHAHVLRFVRLYESVLLRHNLESSGSTALKTRLVRLLRAEGRTFLPPVQQLLNVR